MSDFELVFTLLAIIMGLTLVEMLAGLARALKARPRVRLGWLTPLLAVYVMLDVTGFFGLAWMVRDLVVAGDHMLLPVVAVSGLYYLAASLTFPDDFEDGLDLDQHFFAHKAKVLSAILVCQVLIHVANRLLIGPDYTAGWGPVLWVLFLSYFVVLGGAVFARGVKANTALLAVLIGYYLLDAVAI